MFTNLMLSRNVVKSELIMMESSSHFKSKGKKELWKHYNLQGVLQAYVGSWFLKLYRDKENVTKEDLAICQRNNFLCTTLFRGIDDLLDEGQLTSSERNALIDRYKNILIGQAFIDEKFPSVNSLTIEILDLFAIRLRETILEVTGKSDHMVFRLYEQLAEANRREITGVTFSDNSTGFEAYMQPIDDAMTHLLPDIANSLETSIRIGAFTMATHLPLILMTFESSLDRRFLESMFLWGAGGNIQDDLVDRKRDSINDVKSFATLTKDAESLKVYWDLQDKLQKKSFDELSISQSSRMKRFKALYDFYTNHFFLQSRSVLR